jgi:hypothetical protein
MSACRDWEEMGKGDFTTAKTKLGRPRIRELLSRFGLPTAWKHDRKVIKFHGKIERRKGVVDSQ